MKKIMMLAGLMAFSMNAFAIEFISEDDVLKSLNAEKVIEVSKYSIVPVLLTDSRCADALNSRSARAYIVKKKESAEHQYSKASLYLTPSGLSGLVICEGF